MGMTDRQFDVHLKSILRDLKRIEAEYKKVAANAESETLKELIKDIDEQLKRA